MLSRWLGAVARVAFLSSRSTGQAFAAPSLAAVGPSLFDWPILDAVLRAEPAPDVLVVCRNELLELPQPRTADDVRKLFARGAGVVVRHAQARHAALLRLAGEFEQEFAARAHIQLFVTPGDSYGFGWHYDLDDVVILQTVGQKKYYFRANTQHPRLEPGSVPDFTTIARETSPVLGCVLQAGDALYLPRGMWHVARATEDSLSVSLGLAP
ncbi:MAG: Cupin 4 [Myxococcaceae bacterium]|nr:Cupin 4 [Myxococcaceae bacterium]